MRERCFAGEIKTACQAAALPGTFFTWGRSRLFSRIGCKSRDHPRPAEYIRKKAVLPETGSGGASGTFFAVLVGASEQAENITAAAVIVNKKSCFIVQLSSAVPSVPR